MGRTSQSTTATDARWLVGALALSVLCHVVVLALLPKGVRAPVGGKRETTWLMLDGEAAGQRPGRGNSAATGTPATAEAPTRPRAPASPKPPPSPSPTTPPAQSAPIPTTPEGESGPAASSSTGIHIGDVSYGSPGNEGSGSGESQGGLGGAEGGSGSGLGQGAGGAARAGGGSTPAWYAELHARLAEGARGCYPRAAARFALRGEAQVGFCVGPDGSGRDVELRHSSGASVLDAAVGCVVERAAPFPVQARDQCFVFPLVFGPPP